MQEFKTVIKKYKKELTYSFHSLTMITFILGGMLSVPGFKNLFTFFYYILMPLTTIMLIVILANKDNPNIRKSFKDDEPVVKYVPSEYVWGVKALFFVLMIMKGLFILSVIYLIYMLLGLSMKQLHSKANAE